ncbi:MAG: hypothetical protein LBN29_10900 [Mediterranea sp.]|jgi:hypothetical protein|nr:hypothetical protein [Mediterranea sp.]
MTSNGQYSNFRGGVQELIEEERNVKDDARKLHRADQKAYREEQKLLFTSTKNILIDDIARADRERNSLYVGLG